MIKPEPTFTVMDSDGTVADIFAFKDVLRFHRTPRTVEIHLLRDGYAFSTRLGFSDTGSADAVALRLQEQWDAWLLWETQAGSPEEGDAT